MRQDQHAPPTVMEADRIQRAAEPENDVAPALSAGWTVIELPEQPSKFGLIGMKCLDAGSGEAVEDPELLLAKSLVQPERFVRLESDPSFRADQFPGQLCPHIGRRHHDVGAIGFRQRRKPAANRARLALSEFAERDIHITMVD